MGKNEIQGDDQDQLLDLIGIYGELYLIKYLTESALDKAKWIKEHPSLD